MPLLYYARQSQLKTKEGVKQWHLVLKKVGRPVCLQQLGEMVAEKSSATPGDVHNVIRNLMSVMRMQLLNSRSVRLDGLGTFTVIARTRGRGVDKAEDVSPNQVNSLHFMFTPEYTRSAALGTTRAFWQGVEFEKWTGKGTAAGSEDTGSDDTGSDGTGSDGTEEPGGGGAGEDNFG